MKQQGLALLLLSLPLAAAADQDSYRLARIRYVEPGVSIERATESSVEEAVQNAPFFPGDRLWTDASGRAEVQFAGGELVRLDTGSKLDYLGESDGGASRALRLWAGGLYLRTRSDQAFVIETPGGSVVTQQRGVYRVDVAAGETRLSVFEGGATLGSPGNDLRLNPGERSYARRAEEPEPPSRFDVREDDDFARWDAERQGRDAYYAGNSRRYLPDEVDPYASELDSHGSWYFEAEVGNVWRPYVSAGWRPYYNGRWCWTSYGWTWVPYESWGWAPSHYGRWGYSAGLGWYWIPGAVWGPAWVSWAVGPEYVGWCPLGYRDRPVLLYDNGYHGYAVPRGGTTLDVSTSRAWVTARRSDLTAVDLSKRAVARPPAELGAMRVLESAQLRPLRDFRVADVHALSSAVPRGEASRKPGIGDVVPELRYDNKTTIPQAYPRRHERQDGDRSNDRQDTPGVQAMPRLEHPTDTRGTEGPKDRANDRPPTPGATVSPRSWERRGDPRPPSGLSEERAGHPTDTRAHATERPRVPSESGSRPSTDGPAAGRDPRGDPNDDSHEVMRQFFQPLAEPRSGSDGRGDSGRRPRPESVASPRSDPRQPGTEGNKAATPRPPAQPPPQSAKPRDKDKPHQ